MGDFFTCLGSAIYVIFVIALLAFQIWCMWNIAKKAGYEGVYCLLLLIPFYNLYVIYVFAFHPWPIETQARGGGGEPPPV